MSSEFHTHIYNCLPYRSIEMSNRYFQTDMSKAKLLSLLAPGKPIPLRVFFHFSFKWMTNAFSYTEKHIGFILDFFLPLTSISNLLEILSFILKYIQNPITSQNFHCYCLDTKMSLLSRLLPKSSLNWFFWFQLWTNYFNTTARVILIKSKSDQVFSLLWILC